MKTKTENILKHCSLNIIYSERDRSGNCYWAFTFFDHEKQKTACGTICGGESNLRAVECELRGRWPGTGEPRWNVTVAPMAKRQFKNLTSEWEYAGCRPEEILAFIRKQLGSQ